MNIRIKSFILGVVLVLFCPFLFLYLVAYHHFENKQHIFATFLEYIEGIVSSIWFGITGKHIELFRIDDIDFWYRKGVYISKYTILSKSEVMELKREILPFLSMDKNKKKVLYLLM